MHINPVLTQTRHRALTNGVVATYVFVGLVGKCLSEFLIGLRLFGSSTFRVKNTAACLIGQTHGLRAKMLVSRGYEDVHGRALKTIG